MYKLGIVGYGYVGKGVHRLFEKMVTAIYDPFVNAEGINLANELSKTDTMLFDDKEAFKDLDMAVISVPTNTCADGKHEDFSIVEDSVKWLTEQKPDILILVKSAVIPSVLVTLKEKYKARLVVSPEYMGEGNYFVPFWKYPDPTWMKYHSFQIFGGDKKDTSACIDIFMCKTGPHVNFYQSDLKTAGLCKYMENSWGAMKVTFCNEWYEIAKAHGVDYNELRELWTADSRVEKMHTAVFPKKRGFGGKCFPKDIKEVTYATEDLGYEPKMMKKMIECNDTFTALNDTKK